MKRDEYLIRTHELARRGTQLTQAKLTAEKVREVRETYERARFAIAHINKHYSAAALARKYGVSQSAMEKVLSYASWGHV